MTQRYQAPRVEDAAVTPVFVRNQLLQCFESANREFFEVLGQPVTDEQLRQQVRTFVENVFSQCGVSYVNPTKEGIVAAISECRANAERMMGSQGAEIIRHHYDEMIKLVDRLAG
ncbi:MAG: hypothetical protein HY297_04290 [Thaumarchaeota archaeon]|nr:hypothetical protein [Nitrososphaerota archaeon]